MIAVARHLAQRAVERRHGQRQHAASKQAAQQAKEDGLRADKSAHHRHQFHVAGAQRLDRVHRHQQRQAQGQATQSWPEAERAGRGRQQSCTGGQQRIEQESGERTGQH